MPTAVEHSQKLISASGFQFKGTGWYVTDYARKGKTESTESKETKETKETTAAKDTSSNGNKEGSGSKTGAEKAGKKDSSLQVGRQKRLSIFEPSRSIPAFRPPIRTPSARWITRTRSNCWWRRSCRLRARTRLVNTITPALFKKYRTAGHFAEADTGELETMIHSSGFFRNKAKSIKAATPDDRGAIWRQSPGHDG